MNIALFYHSFASCWNNGNAHFLRGVARELIRLGHAVTVYEPQDGWSRRNALADGGAAALEEAARLVPNVTIRPYRLDRFDVEAALDGADLVLVHEWNEPELVREVGRCRQNSPRLLALFHDTHHRAITAPDEIERFDLDGYDGVLAFGEVLRDIYARRGWGRRAFTWHEAADTALFHPRPREKFNADLIWIGNWGDGERGAEIEEFLLSPVSQLGLRARIHGVRYPDHARKAVAKAGVEFGEWLPNHRVPDAFARARLTAHVPRRPYVEMLPGIPTIRVFEALACGIALICSPWRDEENLFPPDCYISVASGGEMRSAMRRILGDLAFADDMARRGLETIKSRHTCAHRVRELFSVIKQIDPSVTSRTHAHDVRIGAIS